MYTSSRVVPNRSLAAGTSTFPGHTDNTLMPEPAISILKVSKKPCQKINMQGNGRNGEMYFVIEMYSQ